MASAGDTPGKEKWKSEIEKYFIAKGQRAPDIIENGKNPCRTHGPCGERFKNYKLACQGLDDCDSSMSKSELEQLQKAHNKCAEQRMYFTQICCGGQIDEGHAKAILYKHDQELHCKDLINEIKQSRFERKQYEKEMRAQLKQEQEEEERMQQQLDDPERQQRAAEAKKMQKILQEQKLRKQKEMQLLHRESKEDFEAQMQFQEEERLKDIILSNVRPSYREKLQHLQDLKQTIMEKRKQFEVIQNRLEDYLNFYIQLQTLKKSPEFQPFLRELIPDFIQMLSWIDEQFKDPYVLTELNNELLELRRNIDMLGKELSGIATRNAENIFFLIFLEDELDEFSSLKDFFTDFVDWENVDRQVFLRKSFVFPKHLEYEMIIKALPKDDMTYLKEKVKLRVLPEQSRVSSEAMQKLNELKFLVQFCIYRKIFLSFVLDNALRAARDYDLALYNNATAAETYKIYFQQALTKLRQIKLLPIFERAQMLIEDLKEKMSKKVYRKKDFEYLYDDTMRWCANSLQNPIQLFLARPCEQQNNLLLSLYDLLYVDDTYFKEIYDVNLGHLYEIFEILVEIYLVNDEEKKNALELWKKCKKNVLQTLLDREEIDDIFEGERNVMEEEERKNFERIDSDITDIQEMQTRIHAQLDIADLEMEKIENVYAEKDQKARELHSLMGEEYMNIIEPYKNNIEKQKKRDNELRAEFQDMYDDCFFLMKSLQKFLHQLLQKTHTHRTKPETKNLYEAKLKVLLALQIQLRNIYEQLYVDTRTMISHLTRSYIAQLPYSVNSLRNIIEEQLWIKGIYKKLMDILSFMTEQKLKLMYSKTAETEKSKVLFAECEDLIKRLEKLPPKKKVDEATYRKQICKELIAKFRELQILFKKGFFINTEKYTSIESFITNNCEIE